MTEISLKRQARRFAEEHDVSYTRALAAVDEPLHRLKFELSTAKGPRRPGFLLIDSEEKLLEPARDDTPAEYFRQKIRGTDVKPRTVSNQKDREFLFELSRRTQVLLSSGVPNIWEHRALYRAGLTKENLEPVPNYYQRFDTQQDLLVDWHGAALGLFEVAVLQQRYAMRRNRGDNISERQLRSLILKQITMDELQELLHPGQTLS